MLTYLTRRNRRYLFNAKWSLPWLNLQFDIIADEAAEQDAQKARAAIAARIAALTVIVVAASFAAASFSFKEAT